MNMQICLINRLKTKVKNGYCSNQFKKSQNNLKQTWKEIGSLIKRKTKKQTIPTRIIRNGISYENQQDVANQLNSLTTHPNSFILARLMALCFHIFGSVHAMKTEIPPFDSEIKDLTNSSL